MWNDFSIYSSFLWNRNLTLGALIWYAILVIGLWKVFEKAGEDGWKALVPIYNFYILFKISGIAPLFLVQAICALLSSVIGFFSLGVLVLAIYMWFCLAKAFGHGAGFGLGLCLLNPIFIMILGYGGSHYRASFWR